jgi:hypothetical protein
MKKINRPWQALILAFLGGAKVLINSILLFLLLFFPLSLGAWLSQYNPELIVLSALKPIVFLPIVLSIILGAFLIQGLWKGQKWAPIFLTITHILTILLMGLWMMSDSRWAIPLAIFLFLLALEIECWIHPFFKQKK